MPDPTTERWRDHARDGALTESLHASIECVLLDHADELAGARVDANLAELAHVYWQLTGWTVDEMSATDHRAPKDWLCRRERAAIHIEPGIRFGRPMINGVSCEVYAERVAAGETPAEVAEDCSVDFTVTRAEVLLACWWFGMDGPKQWQRRWRRWAQDAHPLMARGDYGAIPDPPDDEEIASGR